MSSIPLGILSLMLVAIVCICTKKKVFAGHEGGVSCGMFSSDGKYVITGGEDGTVRVWNPKKGSARVLPCMIIIV